VRLRSSRPLGRTIAGLLAVGLAAGACGGTSHAVTPPVATPLHAAPEPAVSPPARASLPGTVVAFPGKPEGVAIDAAGLVGVNVRKPDGVVLFPITQPADRRMVDLGGSARHLVLDSPTGPLLVPDESDDTLVEVAVPSGRVVRSVRVGHQPHDAIPVGPHTVFVADELANTVHVLRNGRILRVVKAPLQPGGMAANAAGTRALVVGVRGRRITEYTADGQTIGSANCGAGPTHAAAGDDGLYWVADTLGGAILGFTMGPDGPVQFATIPVGPRPYGLAFDARRDTLWVTVTGSDELLGLHFHGRSVASRTTYATVRQPNTVAVDEATGQLVVTGSTLPGQLQLIPGPTG
jgi:DNA-binding beta-propeller fold protein YncE